MQRSGGSRGIEKKGEKRIRSDYSVNVGQNAFREVPGWTGREKLRRGSMANRKGLDSLDSLFWKAMSVSLVLGGKESSPVVGESSVGSLPVKYIN